MNAPPSALTVADVMTRDPLVFGPWTPATTAERLLAEHRISGAPVVDEAGTVLGVLSQTDLINARAEGVEDLRGHAVGELMSIPCLTAEADLPLSDAAGLMADHHVHRLVILGRGSQRPVGLVSAFDVIRAMASAAGAR